MKNKNKSAAALDPYQVSAHRRGRFWMALIILIQLCIPLVICLIYGEGINFSSRFWGAFIPIVLVNFPACLVEVFTYSPLLGTGGTYLAFITGNLSNLKIPCAMNARSVAGTEIGTKESEIVSTLSIASSAIVTTVVLAVGVILIAPLTPVLESPVLLPAFKTVVPALFGALGYKYAKMYPLVAVTPMLLSITLFLIIPSLTSLVSVMVLVVAVASVIVALALYKKNRI